MACHIHYYCECGNDARCCHYCRKTTSFYRKHYVCFVCRTSFKSKHETQLKETVDGGQLREVQSEHYLGARCPCCGRDADQVGYDFRAPKKKDAKEWKKIERAYSEFSERVYDCSGKGNIYDKRKRAGSKPPWTSDRRAEDREKGRDLNRPVKKQQPPSRTFNGDIEYSGNKEEIFKLMEEDETVLFFSDMSKVH